MTSKSTRVVLIIAIFVIALGFLDWSDVNVINFSQGESSLESPESIDKTVTSLSHGYNTENGQMNKSKPQDIFASEENFQYNLSAYPLLVSTFSDAKTRESFFIFTGCSRRNRYDHNPLSELQAHLYEADDKDIAIQVIWNNDTPPQSCSFYRVDSEQYVCICQNMNNYQNAKLVTILLNSAVVESYKNVPMLSERSNQKHVRIRSCPLYGMQADTSKRLNNWLIYHNSIGITHFRLYHRGVWPNPWPLDSEIMRKWTSSGTVDIVPSFPGFGDPATESVGTDCHMDAYMYIDCLLYSKGYADWIVVNQQDEYLRPLGNTKLEELLKHTPLDVSGLAYVTYDWNATGVASGYVNVFDHPHLYRSEIPHAVIWGFLYRPNDLMGIGAQGPSGDSSASRLFRMLDWETEFSCEHFTHHPDPGCLHDGKPKVPFEGFYNRSKYRNQIMSLEKLIRMSLEMSIRGKNVTVSCRKDPLWTNYGHEIGLVTGLATP